MGSKAAIKDQKDSAPQALSSSHRLLRERLTAAGPKPLQGWRRTSRGVRETGKVEKTTYAGIGSGYRP